MTQQLPNGKQQFIDINGKPLVGGLVYHYLPNTSTPKDTYQDAALTILNTNPVVLDARGQASIYGAGNYRQVLQDATFVQIWDQTIVDISTSFAGPGGSSQIGFIQSGTGAVARTAQDKMREAITSDDFGAIPGLSSLNSVANKTAVQNAFARAGLGPISVPNGDYVISADPTNPTGTGFKGAGNILVPDTPVGYRQISTYADNGIAFGKEYLYRVYAKMALGPAGAGQNVNVFVYGDSTVAGFVSPPAVLNGFFLVQNLLPRLFNQRGMPNVTVTNRGVSSTSWPDLNAIPDIGPTTDLMIIKYAINDAVLVPGGTIQQKIANLVTNMDSKLSAIRNTVGGAEPTLSIILMGPNATKDQTNGRNEQWYEQVRQVYAYMARKYNCAYFDTYAYLRDARQAGTYWLDSTTVGSGPSAENIFIHPLNIGAQWIWAGMCNHLFPQAEHSYWGANNFSVVGSNSGFTPLSTKQPTDYAISGNYGESWEFATVANGFPAPGLLKTYLSPDNYAVQEIYPLASGRRIYRRFAANINTWDTIWTGAPVTLTLLSSWVAATGGYAAPTATLDSSGIVTLEGAIAGGTTTANTQVAALPVGYRPVALQDFQVATASGTCRIRVDTSGAVFITTTGDATRTSLAGITFRAA